MILKFKFLSSQVAHKASTLGFLQEQGSKLQSPFSIGHDCKLKKSLTANIALKLQRWQLMISCVF